MEQTLTNDAYVARPLNELSALSLGEMTFRLIERERDAAREAEVGRLAIELFRQLRGGPQTS